MQALEPEHKRSRRHHPKIDAPQAWYYRETYGDTGEVFFCLANASGQSSRRVFEMHTGRLVGDILTREGDFRHAFPEDITGAIRLNGHWSESEMESWGDEMPMTALDSLHIDLEAARYEMTAAAPPNYPQPPPNKPPAKKPSFNSPWSGGRLVRQACIQSTSMPAAQCARIQPTAQTVGAGLG
jgi:hypothetical protein